MNWKHYQNELIVGAAFLMIFFAYIYKEIYISYHSGERESIQRKIDEINKVVALKKLWDDPRTAGRLEGLRKIVPDSKIQWNKKSTQLNVVYHDISAQELNQLSKIVLNLGVQIKKFSLQREGTAYTVELECKW